MSEQANDDDRFVSLQVSRPGFEAIVARSRQVFDRHTHDAFAFGLIDIDQNKETKLPTVEVDAKGGQLPTFDVDTADVDVGTTNTTIEVPEVKVETEKTKVEVPTISIDKKAD